MCDLKEKEPDPTTFIVDNLLPTGLNILCGSSKIGKSWFALDLAIAVVSGLKFLGFRTTRSDVLYLALEDTRNRIYERTTKLLAGIDIPSNLFFLTEANNLSNHLLRELEMELNANNDVKLIIIDTLQKIRGKATSTENVYGYDYREMSILKNFATERGISFLLIHHTRKALDPDVFNMINGSSGLMAACDTTMILSKNDRMDSKATLSITGRDISSEEYLISFNADTCKWEMESTIAEDKEKKLEEEFHKSLVVGIIFSHPKPFSITCAEIADEILKEYGMKIDSYMVGMEISKFDGILLDKYHISHSFKRTSTKRIHTFEDI